MKFTLKSVLQTNMFYFISFLLVGSVLGFAVCLKIIEKHAGLQISTYSDALFLVAVTETTVGFGDIMPSFFVTRIICVFACFVGITLLSLLIIALNNFIDLSESEVHAYNHVKYMVNCKELRGKAAFLIQAWWKLLQKRKNKTKRFLDLLKFMHLQKRFRILRIQIKSKTTENIRNTIKNFEKVSRQKIQNFTKNFSILDQGQVNMTEIINKEFSISERFEYIKKNYRNIDSMMGIQSLIIDSPCDRTQSSNNKSSINIEVKKKQDHAVKKMLLSNIF